MPLYIDHLAGAIAGFAALLGRVRDAAFMATLDDVTRLGLRAGVIQNFEVCYELCVKLLKRQLVLDAVSASEIDTLNFKDLLRLAAQKGLIASPERWFSYRTQRNQTVHAYDEATAQQVYEAASDFLSDAQDLLMRLAARGVGQ